MSEGARPVRGGAECCLQPKPLNGGVMKSQLSWSLLLGAVALAAAMPGCSQAGSSPGESRENLGTVAQALVTSRGTDPGARGGPAAAGSFFPGLNATEQTQFADALDTFNEVDSVSVTFEAGSQLGPTFNVDSCAMCHAQPSPGGSSPGLLSPQHPIANPQIALATKDGASNAIPPFISASGPVREARFIAVSS